jgi:peptide/nickel transport system substrate-binding protein
MTLKNNDGSSLHPAMAGLEKQARAGEIDRRAFLRTACLLGVSAGSAKAFLGDRLDLVTPASAQTPKTGGTLRMSCRIQEMKDPALVTWIEPSNVFRNTIEYLTLVDADNVSHPYLVESWKPSDDLKTWSFKLRPGVKWSNGDDFTTDDVAFNFNRWTNKDSKSSNKSSFSALESFEKIGPLEFALHLSKPDLAIPEKLYAYTCAIVHRKFEEQGGDWPKNPIGTGPYQLTEFSVSRIAKVKRRDGYWGEKPYLDEIHYIDGGEDVTTQVAALAADQVDLLYKISISELDLVKQLPNIQLLTCNSAQTLCLRMQSDQKPFDDIRVRRAVVLAADNKQMLDVAYRGYGVVGENHHVAPFQPEYAKLPPIQRDVVKAKALLVEAGYPNGVEVELLVGNTQGKYEQDTAQILQQNCAEAGIKINLKVLPSAQYWPIWDKVPFGLTFWAHRPLGVMTLDLAYRSGAAWNESHFKSAEFDAALDEALSIVDPKARAVAMEKTEKILQDACVMVQPYFSKGFTIASNKVKGHRMHPAEYYDMRQVWLDA